MACPSCGSWSVKADRSLAGRLVCGRCGRPLSAGSRGGKRSGSRRLPRLRSDRGGWWLLAALLLGLSAALAVLEPAEQSPAPRLELQRRGWS